MGRLPGHRHHRGTLPTTAENPAANEHKVARVSLAILFFNTYMCNGIQWNTKPFVSMSSYCYLLYYINVIFIALWTIEFPLPLRIERKGRRSLLIHSEMTMATRGIMLWCSKCMTGNIHI
jgi:hypothetical protein